MQFSLGLPTSQVEQSDELLTGAAIGRMAAHAESLGFSALHVTDHPAGDQRWLETGGHHALDPFVALSFAAATTNRIRLHTHILVLAYRNPFLCAKSILTLDVLSGGRLILGVAAGYLRSEFNALGVDYDERNELTDEAIAVIKLALTQDAVAYEGRHFRSRGTTMAPRPTQLPHPPFWIGGNSMRAIRRAVALGQGWSPFPNPQATSTATRTPSLATFDELGKRIESMHEIAEAAGRTEPLDVCVAPMSGAAGATMTPGEHHHDAGALRDDVAMLASMGVTWMTVGVQSAATVDEWCANADGLAADLRLTPAG
jgi:probable F420-dependent oxidoreductase